MRKPQCYTPVKLTSPIYTNVSLGRDLLSFFFFFFQGQRKQFDIKVWRAYCLLIKFFFSFFLLSLFLRQPCRALYSELSPLQVASAATQKCIAEKTDFGGSLSVRIPKCECILAAFINSALLCCERDASNRTRGNMCFLVQSTAMFAHWSYTLVCDIPINYTKW